MSEHGIMHPPALGGVTYINSDCGKEENQDNVIGTAYYGYKTNGCPTTDASAPRLDAFMEEVFSLMGCAGLKYDRVKCDNIATAIKAMIAANAPKCATWCPNPNHVADDSDPDNVVYHATLLKIEYQDSTIPPLEVRFDHIWQDASEVSIEDAGDLFTATDVEGALQELGACKVDHEDRITALEALPHNDVSVTNNPDGSSTITVDGVTYGDFFPGAHTVDTDTFVTITNNGDGTAAVTNADGSTQTIDVVDTDTFATVANNNDGTITTTYADGTSFVTPIGAHTVDTDTFATLQGSVITLANGDTITVPTDTNVSGVAIVETNAADDAKDGLSFRVDVTEDGSTVASNVITVPFATKSTEGLITLETVAIENAITQGATVVPAAPTAADAPGVYFHGVGDGSGPCDYYYVTASNPRIVEGPFPSYPKTGVYYASVGSVNQTFVHNAFTDVLFNTVNSDEHGMYDPINGIMTFPVDGIYTVTANGYIEAEPNAAGERILASVFTLVFTGTDTPGSRRIDTFDNPQSPRHRRMTKGHRVVRASAGDTVKVQVFLIMENGVDQPANRGDAFWHFSAALIEAE